MAARASHRVVRTRYTVIAAFVVVVLSVLLYVKVGASASSAVLQAFGIVSLTVLIGSLLFEKWLWKTWLGQLFGCPPDYSGKWIGIVEKHVLGAADEPEKVRVTVYIKQHLLDIEWHQIGYDEDGNIVTESHLLFGEVIDEHRKWSSICGMYEVNRKDKGNFKHYGSQLVDISFDRKKMEGSYCSTKGNVGTICLEKDG